HGGRCGTEPAVGADVGSRSFTPDMLLPGGKGQHEARLSVSVQRFSDQTAGHAADVFPAAGNHPHAGTAETLGNSKTLTFAAGNIGPLAAGALEKSVGEGFRKGSNEEGPGASGEVSHSGQVLDDSEKVGRLNGNGGQVIHFFQSPQIGPAVVQPGQLHDLITGRRQIGTYGTPVEGMDQARDGDFFQPAGPN